jgi:cob(I)alamin adenosyltransferase
LGADLCLPEESKKNSVSKTLKVVNSLTKRLEIEIDEMNKTIKPIRSFVLPGGNEAASHLHLCRTICRRAERRVVELMETENINLEVLKYLNRLADWFFVAARKSNNNGENDILWKPGMNN